MGPERYYQIFITVDDNGEITTCDIGERIVRTEPADFFFMVGESVAQDLMERAFNYKIVVNGYRAGLVNKTLVTEDNDGLIGTVSEIIGAILN